MLLTDKKYKNLFASGTPQFFTIPQFFNIDILILIIIYRYIYVNIFVH